MDLKHAPLLFGKKNSWNMNGSDWISVIYFGFPINSIKLHDDVVVKWWDVDNVVGNWDLDGPLVLLILFVNLIDVDLER